MILVQGIFKSKPINTLSLPKTGEGRLEHGFAGEIRPSNRGAATARRVAGFDALKPNFAFQEVASRLLNCTCKSSPPVPDGLSPGCICLRMSRTPLSRGRWRFHCFQIERNSFMKNYAPADIRNFAVVGHASSGKTMLCEAMLACGGVINRMGRIADGSTVSDYHVSEKNRQISVSASLLHTEWAGKKLNLIDTPGYLDFISEGLGALRVGDFALVVIHAQHGLGVGTDRVWDYATRYGIPKMIVVNAVDKENVDFDAVVRQVQERFGRHVFPLSVPVNPGPGFNCALDVLRNEIVTYAADSSGKYKEEPATGELGNAGQGIAPPVDRAHRRIRRRVDEQVFRSGQFVGGGVSRRHPRGGAKGTVDSAVLHFGGKQHRRRAPDGFHRQIRLIAGGPQKGQGGQRQRRGGGGRLGGSRTGALYFQDDVRSAFRRAVVLPRLFGFGFHRHGFVQQRPQNRTNASGRFTCSTARTARRSTPWAPATLPRPSNSRTRTPATRCAMPRRPCGCPRSFIPSRTSTRRWSPG